MNKQQTLPGLENKTEKFEPQSLKPGNTFDDVTRNFLIEESKVRDLSSEEIQYLMTDEQYRNKKAPNPAKKKSKPPYLSATKKYNMYKAVASPDELKTFPDEIKKAKAKEVLRQLKQIEQAPIKLNINTPDPGSLAPDSSLDFQKQRLDQMIKESEQEKAREKLINSTRGLASFAPGVFDND